MKTKYVRNVVFVMAVSLILLSADYAVAITDLGQTPRFLSNTILVKLTPQARANLKVTGENVNPVATGVPSLDVISRDHGVTGFLSRHRQAEARMVQFEFLQQLRWGCVWAGQRWPAYFLEWCVPAILDGQCLRI